MNSLLGVAEIIVEDFTRSESETLAQPLLVSFMRDKRNTDYSLPS